MIRLRHVTAGRVHNALRFAGRAAGVQHEERMFGVERLGRTIRRTLRP